MHIATTLDWKSGMVSHFVNGRSFSREKITEKIPIKLSSAFLGHLPRKESTGKKITIKGSIDEFAIFKVSMPESEIRRIYEIGCPYDMPNLLGPKLP